MSPFILLVVTHELQSPISGIFTKVLDASLGFLYLKGHVTVVKMFQSGGFDVALLDSPLQLQRVSRILNESKKKKLTPHP